MGLVNNAGTGWMAGTLDHKPEHIQSILDTNIKGPIFITQATVPHMPPGGRIINISSTASKLGLDELPIYGASKAALDSLTFSWAKEVRNFRSHVSTGSIGLGKSTNAGIVGTKQRNHRELCCSGSCRDGHHPSSPR